MTTLPQPIPGWQDASETLQRFLVQDGLYRWLDLEEESGKLISQMLQNDIFASFDLFCPHCKMITTYRIDTGKSVNRGTLSRHTIELLTSKVFILNAVCLRREHLIAVVLHKSDKRLTKIGQFPSLADLALSELTQLGKALEPLDRKELGRALGLFAHDAPLGAFVYLRRVFERMIARAHQRHIDAGLPKVEGFTEMRMDARIKALRDQLPAKVVQNSNVFGVLSKGIHELSDEEGRALFPLVKSVIFQMLGDEERLRQAREQEAQTDAALAREIERLSRSSAAAEN